MITGKSINKRDRKKEQDVRKIPPMTTTLTDLLKYNRNTPFRNQLLLGTAPDLPSLHDHTNSFLKQKREIKGRFPPTATPIIQQENTEEVNMLREETSSGPSDTTLDTVK